MIATIILIVLLWSDILLAAIKNGQAKNIKYSITNSLISTAIMIILYYYAGIFEVFTK